jgi:hypothetical protein
VHRCETTHRAAPLAVDVALALGRGGSRGRSWL